MPEPSLTAGSVAATTATLTITGHVGDWWLKKTSPTPAGSCTAGEADYSHALTTLTAGTSYTYKAYSDSVLHDRERDRERNVHDASHRLQPGRDQFRH